MNFDFLRPPERRALRGASRRAAHGGRRHHARGPADDELAELVAIGHSLSAATPGVQVDPEFRVGLRAMLVATAERDGIGGHRGTTAEADDRTRRDRRPGAGGACSGPQRPPDPGPRRDRDRRRRRRDGGLRDLRGQRERVARRRAVRRQAVDRTRPAGDGRLGRHPRPARRWTSPAPGSPRRPRWPATTRRSPACWTTWTPTPARASAADHLGGGPPGHHAAGHGATVRHRPAHDAHPGAGQAQPGQPERAADLAGLLDSVKERAEDLRSRSGLHPVAATASTRSGRGCATARPRRDSDVTAAAGRRASSRAASRPRRVPGKGRQGQDGTRRRARSRSLRPPPTKVTDPAGSDLGPVGRTPAVGEPGAGGHRRSRTTTRGADEENDPRRNPRRDPRRLTERAAHDTWRGAVPGITGSAPHFTMIRCAYTARTDRAASPAASCRVAWIVSRTWSARL